MTAPLISVIIPVGPRHATHVRVALASLRWQTLADWEAIVINDTGAPLDVPARVLSGQKNVAANRNAGIAAAQGQYVLCLDADDYLHPQGLETLARRLAHSRYAAYTYGDAYMLLADGRMRYARAPDYEQHKLAEFNLHVVTALYRAEHVRSVGGFDAKVNAWEDWTLPLKLAMQGWCGERVATPVLTYRVAEGERREMSLAGGRAAMDAVLRHYRNTEGKVVFMPCACGGGATPALAQAVQGLPPVAVAPAAPGLVRMRYIGENAGAIPFRSPHTGQTYRGARNHVHGYADVDPRDVAWLTSYDVWEVQPAPLGAVLPPDPDAETPPVVTVPDETPTAPTGVERWDAVAA